jgi:hypothetical protein
MTEPGWVPPGVETRRANAARVYDYWLGGTHNFLAGQDVARAIAAVEPTAPLIGRANRAFIGRAVRFLAANGIRQFLDIGSGMPTQGNVHEVAQQADPGARVAYIDVDPVVVAHSKALLAGNENAAIIEADLREPGAILDHAVTRRLIDPAQPTGLLLVSILHSSPTPKTPAASWRPSVTRWRPAATWSFLMAPTKTGPASPARSRRCTTGASPWTCTCAHARRSSGSSTASPWLTPGWSTSPGGGPIPAPTSPRTRAATGTWSVWASRPD